MNSEINELIIKIATKDPKLLEFITLLPEINCINFNYEKWLRQVKTSKLYVERFRFFDNISYDDFLNEQIRGCMSYIQYNKDNAHNWGIYLSFKIQYEGEMLPHIDDVYSNQFMSKLITTCKNKNIKEFLNFV